MGIFGQISMKLRTLNPKILLTLLCQQKQFIMALKDNHILIPQTCEYITLHAKQDCASVIKIRCLKWEDYPTLSAWVQCHHKCPFMREAEGSESERDLKEIYHWFRGWRKGAKCQGTHVASRDWEKQGNSPLKPPEEHRPADTLSYSNETSGTVR